MLQQLSEAFRDKLGCVAYDSTVSEMFPLCRVDNRMKGEAKGWINAIKADACTNLSGGLFKGIEQQQLNQYLEWGQFPGYNAGGWNPGNHQLMAPPPPAPAPAAGGVGGFFKNLFGRGGGHPGLPPPLAPPALLATLPPPLPQQVGWRHRTPPCPSKLAYPTLPLPLSLSLLQQQQQVSDDSDDDMIDKEEPEPPGSPPPPQLDAAGPAQPAKEVEQDAVRTVFLLTDGLANEGVSDKAQLVALVRKMMDHRRVTNRWAPSQQRVPEGYSLGLPCGAGLPCV